MVRRSTCVLQTPLGSTLAGLFVALVICSGGWMFLLPLLQLLCLIPLAIIMVGTLCGVGYAARIASAIAYEHEQGRFELTGVTPVGLAGISWILCRTVYRDDHVLSQIKDTARGIYYVLGIGLVAVLCATLFMVGMAIETRANDLVSLIWSGLAGISVIGLFYLDLVQSIITGCLMGMLIPTVIPRRADARLAAVGVFLAVQLILYAIALLIFSVTSGSLGRIVRHELYLALTVLTFWAAREALIRWLWRTLADRLDTDTRELAQVSGLA
jgi:MFS family permease